MEFGFGSSSKVQGSNRSAVMPHCRHLIKFFKDKIDAVRMETDKADPQTYSSYSGDEFSDFKEYSMEEIRGVLIRSPAKTCSLDPIPTDVLLESIDILLPFICLMCNSSLSEGCLPGSLKAAIITLVLKKSILDQDDAKNYRPISNLTFISKVIERIVAEQIKKHLVDSNLMPPLQSAYRAGHSTETALIKVISDIIDAADGQQDNSAWLARHECRFRYRRPRHPPCIDWRRRTVAIRGRALPNRKDPGCVLRWPDIPTMPTIVWCAAEFGPRTHPIRSLHVKRHGNRTGT